MPLPMIPLSHSRTSNLPQLASQAAQQATPREAAISMHDYVRDGVLFGWDSGFHERTASQVRNSCRVAKPIAVKFLYWASTHTS